VTAWGISWHLGVDGVSLFLVVLTGILFPLVILGVDPHHDHKRYLAWLLLLEAGVMGSFLSLDLFLFFIFFEIVLVPMYFLIGGWGYDKRVYAATKFFLYTMLGSAFMLVGIIATAVLARRDIGYITFDLVTLAEQASFATNTGRWLFVSFAIAFAVKVPIFPLHTWLPDAHTQAPTGGWGAIENGNVWVPSFRSVLVPRCSRMGKTGTANTRSHRNYLWCDRCNNAD